MVAWESYPESFSICRLASANVAGPLTAFSGDSAAIALSRSSPAGQKATDRLLAKFPDHPAVANVLQSLSNNRTPRAAETLKNLLENSPSPTVKAAAALAIGKGRTSQAIDAGDKVEQGDKFAAEAEVYLAKALDLAKDNAALKSDVEKTIKALRSLRIGKVAPEIVGTDLDEKEFKLTDYRGKVVLLDFWGNW